MILNFESLKLKLSRDKKKLKPKIKNRESLTLRAERDL